MSLYPKAVQRPWPRPYSPERYIVPRVIILHTNAVNAEDPGYQDTLRWHFQVGQHGAVYQHVDTGLRAAANADANGFAISIETWDGGDPESTPWTPAQVEALVALIRWCAVEHSIPLTKVEVWNGWGIGYHRLFRQWNSPVHSCPGDLRAAQFDNEILPRLQQEPDDMTPEQDSKLSRAFEMSSWLAGSNPETGKPTGGGVPHIEQVVIALAARVEQIAKKVGV